MLSNCLHGAAFDLLDPVTTGVGIENLCLMGGMGGDWHGNSPMSLCANSWYKKR